MNLDFERRLTIPMETKAMYPVTADLVPIVEKRAQTLQEIFTGQDDRILLIIGPCSADRPDSVMDYLTRLCRLQDEVADKVFIVPRIYTNKPRTTGDGYMGLLHQPDSTGRPDPFKGIIAVRELHLRALRETGFTSADELLYPENHRYLDDLLAYVSVGARSVEDQQHRLTASGIEIPVGMKNPTGGDLSIMMNGIRAAHRAHTFIYRGWEVESKGNPYAHAVLRGYTDLSGKPLPNYHYEDLERLYEAYCASGLEYPAAIVDTNHANSGKKYLEQIRIAEDVVHSRRANGDLRRLVKGLMIESYLEDGAQKIGENVFGKSITDPCLGWEKTERLILGIAEKV